MRERKLLPTAKTELVHKNTHQHWDLPDRAMSPLIVLGYLIWELSAVLRQLSKGTQASPVTLTQASHRLN